MSNPSPQRPTLTEADKQALADILEERIRKLLKDGTLIKAIYKEGYEELSQHALDNFSLWIGRKIVMLVAGTVFTAILAWALITKVPK